MIVRLTDDGYLLVVPPKGYRGENPLEGIASVASVV